MDLTELPYNALIGIQKAKAVSALLTLSEHERLHNHLGTFHAAALFSLAEASSAAFLLRHRGAVEEVRGVVCKATCKYSKPAHGTLTSQSPTTPESLRDAIATVIRRGRTLYLIDIELLNEAGETVASFTFTWFLAQEL